MLSRNLADVNEALLTTACAEHWPETQTVDFKRQLPEASERGRHEFLKDVCAFANASGGDLVFGVQENAAGQADQVVPIQVAQHAVDATKRRLAQILESGLEPHLAGVVYVPVMLASGDYVLVVRVPGSFQRPHRYRVNDNTRWVVRADTRTADMTYQQIRDAFDRGATLAERARKFGDERAGLIATGANGMPLRVGPRCIVHLIPLATFGGAAAIDVASLYHGRLCAVHV